MQAWGASCCLCHRQGGEGGRMQGGEQIGNDMCSCLLCLCIWRFERGVMRSLGWWTKWQKFNNVPLLKIVTVCRKKVYPVYFPFEPAGLSSGQILSKKRKNVLSNDVAPTIHDWRIHSTVQYQCWYFNPIYCIELTPPEALGIMSRTDDGQSVSPNSGRSSASHNLTSNQL
jgi:hypothetical protein